MSLTCVSDLPRFGIKGPAAADWLAAQGVAVPGHPNAWLVLPGGDCVLRLGRGEYLLEGEVAARLAACWATAGAGVFRVPRHDAAWVLEGPQGQAVLQEICALDTRPQAVGNQVLMTLAAGISVILACESTGAPWRYRLWCDATYGDYLRETLQTLMHSYC